MVNVNPYQLVIDTNVIVSGLKSSKGVSYKLLSILNDDRWRINLSVGLVLEYEAVLKQYQTSICLSPTAIDQVVEDIRSIAKRHPIFYTWRPSAQDPDDDFLIDLAVKCQADFLITYNRKDFVGAKSFGIQVITPKHS